MSLMSITLSEGALNSYFNKINMLLMVGLLACLVFIWRSKASGGNKLLVYIISLICIFIACYLGMVGGILADELNLGGSIFNELLVIILGIITLFFTLSRSGNEKK